MKLSYGLYMAEAETGYLNTRDSRFNALINDFVVAAKSGMDINDYNIQQELFNKNDLNDLSSKEEVKLIKEVEKRLWP